MCRLVVLLFVLNGEHCNKADGPRVFVPGGNVSLGEVAFSECPLIPCCARHVKKSLATTWTKWSQPTRLETRTKESNICASIWVVQTYVHNESESQ